MKVETFAENPDATEALQKALDAGAAGRVYIPPGAYRVTHPLVVHTGTTVLGSGYCSTVLSTEKPLPAILHLRKVGGPMTIVSDLWVAGPVGGNWNATGIWLDNSNGVTVHDCWVSALGTGIRVDGISDTWLRHLVFELNQHGISVQATELGWASGNLRLLDCYGYQNYQAGITLTNCRGVQAHSCSATGSAHAILARHCAQLTIQDAQVNFDGSP
jgi:polygalacturonase